MYKIIKHFSFVSFIRYASMTILVFFGVCMQQVYAEESITLTTYYPAPYGVYNHMSTNKLIVDVGQATATEFGAMTNNGSVRIGHSLIVGSGASYQNLDDPGDGGIYATGLLNVDGTSTLNDEVTIAPGIGLTLFNYRRNTWPPVLKWRSTSWVLSGFGFGMVYGSATITKADLGLQFITGAFVLISKHTSEIGQIEVTALTADDVTIQAGMDCLLFCSGVMTTTLVVTGYE